MGRSGGRGGERKGRWPRVGVGRGWEAAAEEGGQVGVGVRSGKVSGLGAGEDGRGRRGRRGRGRARMGVRVPSRAGTALASSRPRAVNKRGDVTGAADLRLNPEL